MVYIQVESGVVSKRCLLAAGDCIGYKGVIDTARDRFASTYYSKPVLEFRPVSIPCSNSHLRFSKRRATLIN